MTDHPSRHPDGSIPLAEQVEGAFAKLEEGWEALMSVVDRGDLMALGPKALIEFAQRFEAHRTRLAAIDSGIAEAAVEERLAEHTRARSTAGALSEVLRISHAEAKVRLARAGQILPRGGFSTGALDAELPLLAEAVRNGAVSTDQIRVIGVAMTHLRCNPAITPAETAMAERTLIENAAALGPDDLRRVGAKIYDVLVPDGSLPDDRLAEARRGLSISPPLRDGTHQIGGHITGELRALLHATLSRLAAPRPAADSLGPDPRTAPQRLHDALLDACRLLLRTERLPAGGGTPATVHLTIDLDELRAQIGHARRVRGSELFNHATGRVAAATTALGDRLTLEQTLRLASEADIIPTYLTATGGIIAYGRTRRIATRNQTNALIARDAGCSFPSCNAPPEWCERHHVVPWSRGGTTDLDNLTLVCGYHHREFERRGWQVHIDDGVPVWVPPARIYPARTPLTNARVRYSGHINLSLITKLVAEHDGRAEGYEGSEVEPPDSIDDLLHRLGQHISDDLERAETLDEIASLMRHADEVGPPASPNPLVAV